MRHDNPSNRDVNRTPPFTATQAKYDVDEVVETLSSSKDPVRDIGAESAAHADYVSQSTEQFKWAETAALYHAVDSEDQAVPPAAAPALDAVDSDASDNKETQHRLSWSSADYLSGNRALSDSASQCGVKQDVSGHRIRSGFYDTETESSGLDHEFIDEEFYDEALRLQAETCQQVPEVLKFILKEVLSHYEDSVSSVCCCGLFSSRGKQGRVRLRQAREVLKHNPDSTRILALAVAILNSSSKLMKKLLVRKFLEGRIYTYCNSSSRSVGINNRLKVSAVLQGILKPQYLKSIHANMSHHGIMFHDDQGRLSSYTPNSWILSTIIYDVAHTLGVSQPDFKSEVDTMQQRLQGHAGVGVRTPLILNSPSSSRYLSIPYHSQ